MQRSLFQSPGASHQEPRRGIGGAEVAALFGLHHGLDAMELWRRKTGRPLPERTSAAMRRGVALEPVVKELFRQSTGQALLGGQRQRHPRWGQGVVMLAATDGTLQGGGIFEAKTTRQTTSRARDFLQGTLPVEYALQVQHYATVLGEDGQIACLIGPPEPRDWPGQPWQLVTIAWRRLPELGQLLEEAVQRWYQRHIVQDHPPDQPHPWAPRVLELLRQPWTEPPRVYHGASLTLTEPTEQLKLW